MTLQDIVAFVNELDAVNISNSAQQTMRDLNAVLYQVVNSHVQSQDLAQQLQTQYDELRQGLHNFDKIINTISANLKNVIAANDERCQQLDQERYPLEIESFNRGYVPNIKSTHNPDSIDRISARLRLLSNHRLPGLIFRPQPGEWQQIMVTLDPLYVVDNFDVWLKPFLDQFNELYQRRLRQYLVQDLNQATILHKLPDHQFGVVMAYDFFNYKPLPVLQQYLTELAIKLRPGGTLIFTFNDCDVAHNMGLNERCFMMFQPWRLVSAIIQKVGLEIVSVNRDGGDHVWCEVRRPGTITTIRGQQTLAKIVAI